jgi:Protein of unknown function (DUF3999)
VIVAAAPAPPVEHLRYARTLQPAGAGQAALVPDAPMYAHARADLGDLRVVDARGGQVPWRHAPAPAASPERSLPVLNSGHVRGAATALVDRGPQRTVVDRVTLLVPDEEFVGSVTVSGSDDRRTWAVLSTTQIYSVGGAVPARSTAAVVPPTDYRYLRLRATNVSRIDGVTVAATPPQPRLVRLPARVRTGRAQIVVDLGRRVPVEELRISAGAARYDRPFTVSTAGGVVAAGRLVRLGTARTTVVPLAVRARTLRIRIENGDDPPLGGLRVVVLQRPRVLLLEGGHARPYTLYYGGSVAPPVYEFARLPGTTAARPSTLGPEHANTAYRVVDTRGFFARHRSLVTAALALGAAVVLAAGALALRRVA